MRLALRPGDSHLRLTDHPPGRKERRMETSLHRQLKLHYAVCAEQTEVVVEGYRIDAISPSGELIEIRAKLQCSRCHTICETCCEGGRG